MKDVVVIGAGKIGATVAGLLASTGDYQVTLADRSAEVLGNLVESELSFAGGKRRSAGQTSYRAVNCFETSLDFVELI